VTEQIWRTPEDYLRYMEDPARAARFKQIQLRRQGWFDRIYRCFDLVGFEDVAGWRFGVANSMPREETFRNLLDAIRHGEFGMGPKIRIVFMPNKTDMYSPGTFPLRTYVGQVLHAAESNVDHLRNLYAPRDLVRRWFQAREFKLPPWLETMPDQDPTNAAVTAEAEVTHPKGDQAKPQRRIPEAEIQARELKLPPLLEPTQPSSSVQEKPNDAVDNYYTLPETSPPERQRDPLATYKALLRLYPERRVPKMSAEKLAKIVTTERRKDNSLSTTGVVSRESVLRAIGLKK
jgi:hypothetical protein